MADDAVLAKSAVLFFFSGTGNTWWAATRLAGALRDRGTACQVRSVEQLAPGEVNVLLAESDLAGFGYPTHGSDLPLVMKDFLESLPVRTGQPAFVFCTQWMASGDGARVADEWLRKKGFDVRWAEHVPMPNNLCVADTWFFPYTNETAAIQRRLDRAARRIDRFAEWIALGVSMRRGFHPLSRALGSLQRVPFRRAFEGLRGGISVDMHRCTRCGRCVRLCPVGNLVLEDDRVRALGTCFLCARCYDFCPDGAVLYRNRPHDPNRGRPYQGPGDGFEPERIARTADREKMV